MKASAKASCPGCGLSTVIQFGKPSVLVPVVVPYECSACGSHLIAKVIKPKATEDKRLVGIKVLMASKSADLIAMQKEEAEERSQPDGAA